MRYGRTALEVIFSQVVILAAFLFTPFDLVESIGSLGAGAFALAVSVIVASVLYGRHRGRIARSDLGRKIETLRQAPAL